MSSRARIVLFAVGAAGLAAVLAVGLGGLRPFGSPVTAYAALLLRHAVHQRHVTDVVSAVTFDYRGIDTLFEENILAAAATGVAVLLRPLADEARDLPEDQRPDRRIPPPSPTVGLLGVILAPLLVVVGLEVLTHGQVSPGGGFQAGVVLASAVYVTFLATDRQEVPGEGTVDLVEAAEGTGAGGYVVVGVVGLAATGAYLYNSLPLGSAGSLWSGGTIFVLNLVVGLEVTGSFALLATEFLDQTAAIRRHPGR